MLTPGTPAEAVRSLCPLNGTAFLCPHLSSAVDQQHRLATRFLLPSCLNFPTCARMDGWNRLLSAPLPHCCVAVVPVPPPLTLHPFVLHPHPI